MHMDNIPGAACTVLASVQLGIPEIIIFKKNRFRKFLNSFHFGNYGGISILMSNNIYTNKIIDFLFRFYFLFNFFY